MVDIRFDLAEDERLVCLDAREVFNRSGGNEQVVHDQMFDSVKSDLRALNGWSAAKVEIPGQTGSAKLPR